MQPLICPTCQTVNDPLNMFCPACGKRLKGTAVSTSVSNQIVIYFVSFFLPPFGLKFVFSYLKEQDKTARMIGWVALLLTVISLIITVVILMQVFTLYQQITSGDFNALPKGAGNDQLLNQIKALQ